MDPIKFNKKMLTIFGASTTSSDTSMIWKTLYIMNGIINFLLQAINFLACLSFLLKYASVDMKSAFFGILETFGVFPCAYSIVVAIMFAHKFRDVFVEIQEIYRESM